MSCLFDSIQSVLLGRHIARRSLLRCVAHAIARYMLPISTELFFLFVRAVINYYNPLEPTMLQFILSVLYVYATQTLATYISLSFAHDVVLL